MSVITLPAQSGGHTQEAQIMADTTESLLQRVAMARQSVLEVLAKNGLEPGVCKPDWRPSQFSAMSTISRGLAMAAYLLDHDIPTFKRLMTSTASLALKTVELVDTDPRPGSYRTLDLQRDVLDAMAAGAWPEAAAMAAHLLTDLPSRLKGVSPLIRVMGRAVLDCAMGNLVGLAGSAANFRDHCRSADRNFIGFAEMLQAIASVDSAAAQRALPVLVENHRALSVRYRALWYDLPDDRLLCIWGLALVNAARRQGLPVPAAPPVIPDDLLVPIGGIGGGATI
jgi:hypothetical protein